MAILKDQEFSHVRRDVRMPGEKLGEILSHQGVTIGVIAVTLIGSLIHPGLSYLLLPVALIWWAAVTGNVDRQVLPLFLPAEANCVDYNNPNPGNCRGFQLSKGMIFLGNSVRDAKEIWATSDFIRRHLLIFGTTGAGKTQLLMGLFTNFLAIGSGIIFSDAKGTTETLSVGYRIARRFGRDGDFLIMNYSTGGTTIRSGARDRRTNTMNFCAFANGDQITQIWNGFLPKSSGENQMFQDKAVAMISNVTPALVDLRDLHGHTLNVDKFADYVSNLRNIMNLALDRDGMLPERTREDLRRYLSNLGDFDTKQWLENPDKYQPGKEAMRMFGYASQYFTRALSSLSQTYGHIYRGAVGEVDYKDVVTRRRIVYIVLPAMEKAPTELQNIAKINLNNIRGAIALTFGDKVEGYGRDTIDNLPSSAETPMSISLDEYGYQTTEGFAITGAQARGANFSITYTAQDFSNLEIGDKTEAEAIFGNATPIYGLIKNTRGTGERATGQAGEADIAVHQSLERLGSVVKSFNSADTAHITRRARIEAHDLFTLKTGHFYMIAGTGDHIIHFAAFAPAPPRSDYMRVNRFLPIVLQDARADVVTEGAAIVGRLLMNRLEGNAKPRQPADLPPGIRAFLACARSNPREASSGFVGALDESLSKAVHAGEEAMPALSAAELFAGEPVDLGAQVISLPAARAVTPPAYKPTPPSQPRSAVQVVAPAPKPAPTPPQPKRSKKPPVQTAMPLDHDGAVSDEAALDDLLFQDDQAHVRADGVLAEVFPDPESDADLESAMAAIQRELYSDPVAAEQPADGSEKAQMRELTQAVRAAGEYHPPEEVTPPKVSGARLAAAIDRLRASAGVAARAASSTARDADAGSE